LVWALLNEGTYICYKAPVVNLHFVGEITTQIRNWNQPGLSNEGSMSLWWSLKQRLSTDYEPDTASHCPSYNGTFFGKYVDLF